MAKLGTTKRPLILRIGSQERAMAAVAICKQHGWHYVLGMEPDKPEDLRDLESALRRAGPADELGALGEMVPFIERFPDIAERETRTVKVGPDCWELPEDEYAFVENYCADPSCDCGRVLIAVVSILERAQIATISHAFEPPSPDEPEEDQTFLDPLGPQCDLSPTLLELFEKVALSDEAYRRRLESHYHLMRETGGTRRIVAASQRTVAPLSRSAMSAEERTREANRRKRQRQRARKQR